MTNQYRKKPVIIEARQLTYKSRDDVAIWAGARVNYVTGELFIPTLEGEMKATPRDWIIKGAHGEFYPCKPDIFAATYEPLEYAT
jgi:hypothetical protein